MNEKIEKLQAMAEMYDIIIKQHKKNIADANVALESAIEQRARLEKKITEMR